MGLYCNAFCFAHNFGPEVSFSWLQPCSGVAYHPNHLQQSTIEAPGRTRTWTFCWSRPSSTYLLFANDECWGYRASTPPFVHEASPYGGPFASASYCSYCAFLGLANLHHLLHFPCHSFVSPSFSRCCKRVRMLLLWSNDY